MVKNKTSETTKHPYQFILEFTASEQKRKDSYALIDLMQKVTGLEPKMWGPSIIGFGTYHYRYDSGHEGDAPLLAFSPRKAALTLYVTCGTKEEETLLKKLGKFTKSKACVDVKKLEDIDQDVLLNIMKASLRFTKAKYKQS